MSNQQWDTSQWIPPNPDPNQVQNQLLPAFLAYLHSFQQQHQHSNQQNQSTDLSNPSKAPKTKVNYPKASQISPQKNQPRKRTRCTSPSDKESNFNQDNNRVNEAESTNENFVFKFSSKKQFPQELRCYLNLDKELKRCLPNSTIINAYINQKNELVIKTDSKESMEQLVKSWPKNAFVHGVEQIPQKESKFYLALLNVSKDFDITNEENLAALKSRFNITKALRVVKKSTNEQLKTIKALINDRDSYERIIKDGKIQINSTIVKARPWRFNVQPNQCFHCQKIGHMKQNCPNKDNDPTCVRCSGKHSHEICTVTDPALFKCVNCTEKHPSCSKQCQAIINEVNRKKSELQVRAEKSATSNFNRVYSETNTVYNIRSIPHSNLDNFVKSMLNLFIDIIKFFNQVTELVEENPQFFANLVNKNLGKNYGQFVMNRLVSEINSNFYETSTNESNDENDMEYYQDE